MKCLLVFFGESFRLGGQGNRNIGSPESYKGQIEATKSHIEFINYLKKLNFNAEVFVNTYKTQYEQELIKLYKENVGENKVRYNTNPKQIGLQPLFNQCCELVKSNLSEYEFVFFIRIDLILKNKFKDVFYFEKEKVLWPSICFAIWAKNNNSKGWHRIGDAPRVNDVMVYVPKKHFCLIEENKIEFGHHGWIHLRGIIGSKNQGLILKTLHDSDSEKDWNPIYKHAGRQESDMWNSTNFIIDQDLFVHLYLNGKWTLFDELK